MTKTSIPVIKYLFKEELKVLSDALSIGPGFEIEEFANSNDLSTYLATMPAGLVVTSLHDRNDLIQIATFMKLGKKVAKDCAVKIVVFNFSKDRNFEKAVAKLGILDIVEPGINTKALKFKIDFWMKSLNAQVKNNTAASTQKVKTLEQNKTAETKGPDTSVINWVDPLDLEEDIWILKQDNDCKKVLSKWLIRLLGPSPYVGQWTESKSGLWRFDFKETEKELFVSGDGAWFFSGDQKPDFVWKENIWLISGDNFDLFYKNSSGISSRLNCKNKIISVCKNSEFAKTKEQTIIESFDKELVFKREADLLEDMEGKNKTDQLNHGNLEGKNKTDEIDGGPLEGKSKTSAERSGNLTGKTEGQEKITHDNLEQKISTGREKTHWNNKNSYEEESKGDHSVNSEKHRNGANLERENKDHEHKKYYKNHNEAEKYEAGELGKGLSGKSSTDQLASHYDNSKKNKENSPATAKEKENELSGKSDTDKLKSHYGRKDNSEASKEKEAQDLDGKSSTDKLASHYGRTNKESSEAEAKERAEKTSHDRNFESKDKEKTDKVTPTEKDRADKAEKENKTFGEKEIKEKAEREAKIPKERDERERKAGPEVNERERGARNNDAHEAAAPGSKKEAEERAALDRTRSAEEKNHRESAEREKNAPVSAKEKAERNKESAEFKNTDKKQLDESSDDSGWERGNRKEEVQGKTRKNEHSENEERSKKTGTEKDWEGEHDYGFKGDDSTILNRRKKDETDDVARKRGADVLPLDKAREEKNKQKTVEEKELEKITEDARVISILTLNNRQIHCGLDDFFDETIIFHTDDPGFTQSSDVNLDLKFKFMQKDTQLKINGNVLTVEDDGEGKNYVTVQLSKENAVAFDTFMKLYEIRQQNVTEFLKKAKGY